MSAVDVRHGGLKTAGRIIGTARLDNGGDHHGCGVDVTGKKLTLLERFTWDLPRPDAWFRS